MQLAVDQRVASGHADVLVVAPAGEIDLATAAQLREGLERAESETGHGLVVDLRKVEFIDSTGIGELVGCHRRCRDKGRPLAFVVPEGTIRKILNVTGMDSVFDMHRDETSAIREVTADVVATGSDD